MLNLTMNNATGLYEAVEDGITYCMPFSLMDKLKRDFKTNYSVAFWYNRLSTSERKQVYREGLPSAPPDMYDDIRE